MNKYNTIPTDEIINKTILALKANGINAEISNSKEDARKRIEELIPTGSEVMTNSSVTLEQSGINELINNSDNFVSVKNKLFSLDREKDNEEMQKLGATPNYSLGSVHAVTQDGIIIIASYTGSQLPGYAYSSNHVIWVVSAKKITDNLEDGLKRLYEYVLPLESERVKEAYGMEKSNVSKLLIINKEVDPQRLTMIIVKEDLGY